jgi:hypothetical protein
MDGTILRHTTPKLRIDERKNTMKKWGIIGVVVILLAAPMLACGFPLPAGTEMMAVSKAICADGETSDSCQVRQDAYQLMGKVQTAKVPDLHMSMNMNTGTEVIQAEITGSFDYVLAETNEGLGAQLHITVDEGQINNAGEMTDLTGVQLILLGDTAYTSADNGDTWSMQTLDQNTRAGISMIAGLAGPEGAALDFFAEPTTFGVTLGEDVEDNGQMMSVQTMSIDLPNLMASPETLTSLIQDLGVLTGSAGLDLESSMGMPVEEIAPLAGMLLPFLAGSEFSTTVYIGQEDGYIHYIEDKAILNMDMTSVDPNQAKIEFSYVLSGHITEHNAPLVINEPANVTQGAGSIFGDSGLFGSGN